MIDFAYSVLDANGRERSGSVKAADETAARSRLEKRGYYVLKLSAHAGDAASEGGLFKRSGRMRQKELAMFTRQLASLVAVSPLEETLRTLARQNEKPRVRAIIDQVHGGVVEGLTLADAMKRAGRSFPPLYRAMISAGESSGSLPLIADRLAMLLERQVEMRGKLVGALVYPLVLAFVAIVVVAMLMISVVPRVVEQFDGVEQQLPLITRIVISISDFLASWWLAILLVVAAAVIFAVALLRSNEAARYRFDAALLRLPLVGKLLRNLNAARMARTLATMVASRLPVLEGLRLTTGTVGNLVLRDATKTMADSIRGGSSLSGTMRAVGVFPPLLVYLAASGEQAGQLDVMLEKAADYLEKEFDDFTSAALTLLEPIIIVLMGGAVAVIILAILLPILQLQSLVGS